MLASEHRSESLIKFTQIASADLEPWLSWWSEPLSGD